MQVSTINNQTNPVFNAQIKYFGDKRALPLKALKKLEEKAGKFGMESDTIYFFLKKGLVIEKKLVSTFMGDFYKNSIEYFYNKILVSYRFPSIKDSSEKHSFAKIFSHNQGECKEKTYQYLNQYLDNLKSKFGK